MRPLYQTNPNGYHYIFGRQVLIVTFLLLESFIFLIYYLYLI